MQKIIKSDKITVAIDTFGAQLKSVKDIYGTEFMWDGDPNVWGGTAPVLFPICGSLKNDKYTYNGKEYSLLQHGLAKRNEFSVESHSENKITFLLVSNEKTREQYPFDFEFRVVFKAEGNTLSMEYNVKNTGDETMYFSLGGHEGYATPEGIDDYEIIFDRKVTLDSYDLEGPLADYTYQNMLTDSEVFPLTDDYFVVDTLVFLNIASKVCTLSHKNGGRKITLDYSDFDNLMIWHVPGGKYICLEPWNGIPDRVDSDGILKNKEGIIPMEPGKTYSAVHKASFVNE